MLERTILKILLSTLYLNLTKLVSNYFQNNSNFVVFFKSFKEGKVDLLLDKQTQSRGRAPDDIIIANTQMALPALAPLEVTVFRVFGRISTEL